MWPKPISKPCNCVSLPSGLHQFANVSTDWSANLLPAGFLFVFRSLSRMQQRSETVPLFDSVLFLTTYTRGRGRGKEKRSWHKSSVSHPANNWLLPCVLIPARRPILTIELLGEFISMRKIEPQGIEAEGLLLESSKPLAKSWITVHTKHHAPLAPKHSISGAPRCGQRILREITIHHNGTVCGSLAWGS